MIFKDGAEGQVRELTRITKVKNLGISKEDHHKDSFTPGEVSRLLDGAAGDLRTAVALMYFAGLRVFEVAGLQVEDVRGDVILVQGKGADHKTPVPVNGQLLAILREQVEGRKKGQLLQGASAASIRSDANRLLSDLNLKAGQHKRSCHSLRHSFVQHLIEKGVPLHLVQQLARHKSIATTEIYFRKAAKDKEKLGDAVNVLSA